MACGFHPSLGEGEGCGFCVVEGFGLDGGGEHESLQFLLRLLCLPYRCHSHQELRLVLVAYVGPFFLELMSSRKDLLPVLTELCLVCLQVAQHDDEVLNVWRESCIKCLLSPLRLHGDKLPLLQLAVHTLVDATRAMELMLLSANEASCCSFVWQEMVELVLNEPEVGRQVLLQAPPQVFLQGVRQRDANCSACFQLLVGELPVTEELCREPDFAQFLCASVCPQVLMANTIVVLLGSATTLGGDLEHLVERVIGELYRGEAEAALALEAMLHQHAVPTTCAIALAHAIVHMERAEHRQRMYKALARSPSSLLDAIINEWNQGSVILEADALALLLLPSRTLGNEQRDLEALYQFVAGGRCQSQPVLSLVCEIARMKILTLPALLPLGLALVGELGQQVNVEYHDLMCCLLERERDETVTSFAIALQQTGYLAVMLRNISALGLSRVKHLLQLVLGLIDFPFFLSLDHINFALGADISRHAERIGSEASLCLICALLWDVHLPSGADGYAKALLPWTLDQAVPTSCLIYLLLLSSLRAYEVLVPNVQMRFRALSSEMRIYVATCLLRITRQRSLQVQCTGFALLLETGFNFNPLEFGWSGEKLLEMLFESEIGLELFAAVLELIDNEALYSALQQQQREWATPSKLFLLTNKLLLRLSVGFTPEHLVTLDGLAAICLEHGVELDALPTTKLPSSVAGVQLRASVLKTSPNQQLQTEEEPLPFQLAVMERLSTGQFSQGDLSWLLVCFQQHRLPQATWRKVLIKLLCGGDHLEARVLAAEILESLHWEEGMGNVDYQRCFDKALELFAIHHQTCGLRLMIRISLASISADRDEGYVGQGVYSLVASAANSSTLLVLLVLMNGGQRPLDDFVKQRLAELLPSGTGAEHDLPLVLVLVLVLHRLKPEIQLMELARARLRCITTRSVGVGQEENIILSGDLHRAAESGWGLTLALAELVLGLSLSPTATITAPALAHMLLELCKI